LFAARPLELFAKVFRAPLWIFNRTGAWLGRLIGLKSSLQHAAVYNEAELRQLVDIARESGHLRAEERRLIHGCSSFQTRSCARRWSRAGDRGLVADCSLADITRVFQQESLFTLARVSRIARRHGGFHSQQGCDEVSFAAGRI